MGDVTKQECVAKDLAKLTKKFETPEEIVNDAVVSFYCKADDCNVAGEITKVLKEDVAKTLEAMKAVGHAVTEDKPAGAAQTTVAVATIAFSMAMARLAL